MNSTKYLSYIDFGVLINYIKTFIRQKFNKSPFINVDCKLISYNDKTIEVFAVVSKVFKKADVIRCSLSDFSCTFSNEKTSTTQTTDFMNCIYKQLCLQAKLSKIPNNIPLNYLNDYNQFVSPQNTVSKK